MRRQHGVVLLIALIVLVAMTLTGIAMVRSIDTGLLIAGNLASRQGGATAGDMALESALGWLTAPLNPANVGMVRDLNIDHPDDGYFATWQNNFDPAGVTVYPFDWSGAPSLPGDAAHNSVRYVIHRMCSSTGPASTAACAMTTSAAGGGLAGSMSSSPDYARQALTGAANVYYRITARIDGPRNTVTYVQALIY